MKRGAKNMPGFILHMTAAQMLFEKYHIPANRDAFEVGNLIPDSVSDKTFSHFRHPERNEKLMVYPDMDLFLDKYKQLLSESSCLGYYFHLFTDRIYAKDYIAEIVEFFSADGHLASDRADITHAFIKRTKELVPIKTFFSDEYYYGDFTKLNTYLLQRFRLSTDISETIQNPGIDEVDYTNISTIKTQLKSYLDVPENAVQSLKVFDIEHLLSYLEQIVDDFAQLMEL